MPSRRHGVGDRLLARTEVRLALVQALVVITAFALAGWASQLAIDAIARAQLRREVAGEAVSLHSEYRQKGADHLPHTVEKRSRLWRGFDYGWTSADGRMHVGALPALTAEGWETVRPVGRGGRSYLVQTERLPDGTTLSIGRDLSQSRTEMARVAQVLVAAGLAGASFCLIASYLFSRRVWRRLDALAAASRQVAGGDLQARAPTTVRSPPDDIDEVAEAFNAMMDKLVALIAQVRQVSSDIAHDLRTPLTRVRQRLDRLGQEALSSTAASAVERIEADIEEVLRTFDALLRLAEIEEGVGLDSHFDVADLDPLVRRMAETYRPDIEASGRQLRVHAEPAPIRCDLQLIAQALANLLDNALRHTPPCTAITLDLRRHAGAVRLSVSDEGPGVPEADRGQVLQRFGRLDRSRTGGGSGLGLAIVAAIAARHDAALELSDAAPGLTVALTFGAAAAL